MASSLPYNPFRSEGCLPCRNTADSDQSQYNHQCGGSNQDQAFYNGRQNNSIPEMKQTEDLLASETNKLSLEDRNRAFDDVHCVGEELKETPEMVEKALAGFDQAVQSSQNPIYEIALNQNRAYVEDPSFRLAFLRANFHDVEKSVRQMMNFLQNKAKYFGQNKVAREIVLSDLTGEDIAFMSSGFLHIQDGSDRMGRPILHNFDNKRKGNSIDCVLRVIFFVWWNLIVLPNKNNVQIKGIQGIAHASSVIPDFNYFKEAVGVLTSIPVRISSVHMCLETSSEKKFVSSIDGLLHFLLKNSPQQLQVRCRLHYGSSVELQYQLRCHGIPTDTFPLDQNGNFRKDITNLWFEKFLVDTNQTAQLKRSAAAEILPEDVMKDIDFDIGENESYWNETDSWEAMTEPIQVSNQHVAPSTNKSVNVNPSDGQAEKITPTDIDVLFGRGHRLKWHPGNVRLRKFLLQHREEYENPSGSKKREVCLKLVAILRNGGVRFLQKSESGGWVENGNMEAIETKISQIFREFRKKERRERYRV